MKIIFGMRSRIFAACLIFAAVLFVPTLTAAQAADRDQNSSACRSGLEACDYAPAQPSQMSDLVRAEHRRNVANCRDAEPSCDRAKLTPAEASAVAVAQHQRNVSHCME